MTDIESNLLYDNFITDMADELNDLHIKDDWKYDSRAIFAFNQGIKYAEKQFKDQIEYLIYGISCERSKKERLIEILRDNNFSVTEFLNTIFVMNLNALDN